MNCPSRKPNPDQTAKTKTKTQPRTSTTSTADTSTAENTTASENETRISAMPSSKAKSKSPHRRSWTFLRPQTQSTLISNIHGLLLALTLAALSIVAIKLDSSVYVSGGIWLSAAAVLCMFKRITLLQLVIAVLISLTLMDRAPTFGNGVDAQDVMLWLVYAQCVFTAICLIVAFACRFA
jgi:hypothetical protein